MGTDEKLELPYPRPLSGAAVARLPPALVPARSQLAGKLVCLEPLDPAKHGDVLYDVSHATAEARRIWDYLPSGPWPSREAYLQVLREQAASFERIFYAIRALHSGRVCGQASYLDIHPQNGVIEIGYIWFGPELQRTRAATEALYLMLRYALDDLGYRRMQWRCNSLNQKSRRAAKRLGFRFEGVFYNHMIFKGKNRDTAWYSILDDEWPEVRGIIETWLAADNFDHAGKPRRSLTEMMQHRNPSTRSGQ